MASYPPDKRSLKIAQTASRPSEPLTPTIKQLHSSRNVVIQKVQWPSSSLIQIHKVYPLFVTGNSYAIKHIVKKHFDVCLNQELIREWAVMDYLSGHDHTIPLHQVIQDGWEIRLVAPFYSKTLFDVIYKDKTPYRKYIVSYTRDLCIALDHMHRHGIIHRDLKPDNIMVSDDNHLVVIDFGISKSIAHGTCDPEDMTNYVVTRWYRAPELLMKKSYNERIDIWSLGCILDEMVSGEPLFKSERGYELSTIFGTLRPPASTIPDDMKSYVPLVGNPYIGPTLSPRYEWINTMILSCLRLDPDQRPDARELWICIPDHDPPLPDGYDSVYDLLWDNIIMDNTERVWIHSSMRDDIIRWMLDLLVHVYPSQQTYAIFHLAMQYVDQVVILEDLKDTKSLSRLAFVCLWVAETLFNKHALLDGQVALSEVHTPYHELIPYFHRLFSTIDGSILRTTMADFLKLELMVYDEGATLDHLCWLLSPMAPICIPDHAPHLQAAWIVYHGTRMLGLVYQEHDESWIPQETMDLVKSIAMERIDLLHKNDTT